MSIIRAQRRLEYKKMAVNEERAALWRTPLSTPVRNNENGYQDLFRHSEKLLASALSICRLKGSVECQIGGMITVCEEMQRLLRLSFSESARLEKELKKQQVAYDEDITMLKERISYLEEINDISKPYQDTIVKKTEERSPLKPHRKDNIMQNVDSSSKQAEKPVVAKTSKCKLDSSKVVEIKTPESDTACGISDECNQNDQELNGCEESKVKEKSRLLGDDSKSRNDLPQTESHDLSEKALIDTSKPGKPNSKRKTCLSKKKSEEKDGKSSKKKSKTTTSDVKEKVNKSTEGKNEQSEIICSNSKSHEENESDLHLFDAEFGDSDIANNSVSSDVYLNPESGLLEMIETSEVELEQEEEPTKNTKKKKASKEKNISKTDTRRKTGERKLKKDKTETKRNKELEKVSEIMDKEFIPESPKSAPSKSPQKSIPKSTSEKRSEKSKEETAAKRKTSLPKTSPQVTLNEEDEMLGDISFLIDISSMISSFVSDPDSQQLELPLMEARKRADARKLAALFNLHISIGSKSENSSSLILSKTVHSQMPKPGKLDNLLSKLSIAAAKEAERVSSKARTKRKLSAVVDNTLFDEDTDSQTKRKSLSRSKKARI